jgi:hypothetical protein
MRRRRSLVRLCRLPWLALPGHRRPTHRGLRRPGIRVAVSSKQNADNCFSTSDPGMSMKTTGSVKRSWVDADVAFERLRCAEGAVWSDCAACPGLPLRVIADPHIGVCASRDRRGSEPEFEENKARMSMKTKDRSCKLLRTFGVALTFGSAGKEEPPLTCRPETRRYEANHPYI